MVKIEALLRSDLTAQERIEAVEDAKAFLRDAVKMQRRNLNAFLGRNNPHSIITAEISGNTHMFYIMPYPSAPQSPPLKGVK